MNGDPEEVGPDLSALRRDTEASVRIPPFEVVVQRHARRRRRRVGAGGLALAAVTAAVVVGVPALTRDGGPGRTPQRVQVAGHSAGLTLTDVSFAPGGRDGTLLGQVCTDGGCHDVAMASDDGGGTYGVEVAVPGHHRYVAASEGGRVAYGPDLAVLAGGAWTALDVPAPVADVAVTDDRMWVLLTPTDGPARLWSGPADATSWSAFAAAGDPAPGSDDTARLAVPSASRVVVVSDGGGAPRTVAGTLDGSAVRWDASRPLTFCDGGSSPSLSAVGSTWWVACRGEATESGAERVGRSTDGGDGYAAVEVPVSGLREQRVTALSGETAYLSGGPALLVTTDGGNGWPHALDQPALGPPHVPTGTGGESVWTLAPGGSTVWRTTGGGTWVGLTLG